ncbi:MAG: MarR family transcriptional regulator [Chloroflexi bacterium]|nr:MarR family transcriptional regulator [Chloroflexota bacterium]
MQDEREELISHIVEASRHLFHRCLQLGGHREWAEVDLTMPQLKVLFVVAAGKGVTMTHLASAVGMTLSTATGVADRLIAQGLVHRQNDPADRRLVLLLASQAGIMLVDRLIQVGQERLERIAMRLTVEELRLVAQAHDLLCRAALQISGEERASSRQDWKR